ncbi:unnamed protein product [Calypogeia fissa]
MSGRKFWVIRIRNVWIGIRMEISGLELSGSGKYYVRVQKLLKKSGSKAFGSESELHSGWKKYPFSNFFITILCTLKRAFQPTLQIWISIYGHKVMPKIVSRGKVESGSIWIHPDSLL